MNDTSKILKELSNLTLNLDVLAKELKEANGLTKDTNKELSSLVKETKDSVPKEKVTEKTGDEKNFKNFAESIINAFTKQNESLVGTLEKNLKGGFPEIPKSAIKPAGVENQTQAKPGLVTKDLISAVAGRLANIPKLQDGGKIDAGGVALVGEKGPELVELKKGNIVNSQDKMAELLKMEEEDMFSAMLARDEKEKKSQSDKGLSEIVSGSPKLGEFVTNGYGVKVPKSEIDKERESLLKEDKEYYDENPEDLEEDIENFIRSYRETMTVSDIQKLSEKTQPVEIKKSEEELQKSKTDKPEKEKSKLKDFLSSNPLQNLKEGGMKLAEKLKPNLEQLSDKGMNLAEKFKPKQEQLSDKGMESENSSSQNVSAKDIQALTERLKQGSKLDKETQTLKTGQKSSPTPAAATSENISATSPVEKNAGVKPDIQTTKPEKATQASSPSVMTDQDIKEIKGLLAGIYKSINGPLSIASDRPYRPNSNTF
jgi:hypothetical protein